MARTRLSRAIGKRSPPLTIVVIVLGAGTFPLAAAATRREIIAGTAIIKLTPVALMVWRVRSGGIKWGRTTCLAPVRRGKSPLVE